MTKAGLFIFPICFPISLGPLFFLDEKTGQWRLHSLGVCRGTISGGVDSRAQPPLPAHLPASLALLALPVCLPALARRAPAKPAPSRDSGRENKVFFAFLPVDAGMVVVGQQWLCVHACVQMKPQSTKYPKDKVSKNQSRGQKQDMR